MSGARGRRLAGDIDAAMQSLNQSVDVDSRLWREDLTGSLAHLRALEKAGVLSAKDAASIAAAIEKVRAEIENGELEWDPAKEDVHMNVEARIIALAGAIGGQLHAGRSRNDQVATDLRLWARSAVDEVGAALDGLAGVIVDRAEAQIDVLMPTYTHLQRAQPSRLSHHLMAWQEMLWRDRGRLIDARGRLNESPLGSGAGAGSGFPLDRAAVAEELGFDRPTRNSIDATSCRDFLMELGSALAILGVHLSRISEEIVLWSTREFGFLTLSDRFSTSSSMMPQKKNPDVAELVRGKSARLIGNATALLALEKGLPFGYDRDLQEDKRPIFDAVDDVLVGLKALAGAIATATFHGDALAGALEHGHVCATDLADYLVSKGVPFRDAHHVVGGLVRTAEGRGCELGELLKSDLASAHETLSSKEALACLDPLAAVERRTVIGGPARARVLEAIVEARGRWGGSGEGGA